MSPREVIAEQRRRIRAAEAATAAAIVRAYRKVRIDVPDGWDRRLAAIADEVALEVTVFAAAARVLVDDAVLAAHLAGATDAETLVRLTAGATWRAPLPAAHVAQLAAALRPGAPLRLLFDELGPHAGFRARRELTRQLLLGRGPRQAAVALRRATGLSAIRALTISRTEIIGAYRRSSLEGMRRSGVLDGWVWMASLSARTCGACLAMHGTEHPWSEPFSSHPSCRCTPAPLGVGLRLQPGESWLASQSEGVQVRVLGPGKRAAWAAGRFDFRELAQPTLHPVWGPGLRERALRDLIAA